MSNKPRKTIGLWVVLLSLWWPTAIAQEPSSPAPELTVIQRQQFQLLSLQMDNAQLRFQAAQTEIARLVVAVRVEGYTFDLASLSYRPDLKPSEKASP